MKCRNLAILVNPRAGKGSAYAMVERISRSLENAGCIVSVFESRAVYDDSFVVSMLQGKDAVVIAGGDGTVLGFLAALKGNTIPLYMLPCGNQSLAAKLFNMSGECDHLLACLREGLHEQHYLASINGIPFLHMCSLGFDSSIVDAVHTNRSGPVGNIAYIKSGLSAFISRREPKVNVVADGEAWIHEASGFLFIANSPMYACGTNPIPDASSLRPELDVAFLEGISMGDYLAWCLAGMRGRNVDFRWSARRRASQISIEVLNDPLYPIQADGDIAARGLADIEAGTGQISVLKTGPG